LLINNYLRLFSHLGVFLHSTYHSPIWVSTCELYGYMGQITPLWGYKPMLSRLFSMTLSDLEFTNFKK